MFDLNDSESTTVVKRKDPMLNVGGMDEAEPEDKAEHSLDSTESVSTFNRLLEFHRQELDRQYDNRIQQAIDEDYYDHEQWTPEEKQALEDRGQAPLVYNVIAQSVNWVIGSEKRGRTDFRILPREESDTKAAETKTALLKYLSDVNKTPFDVSRAFEDTTKVGVGWLEDGAAEPDDGGEFVYSKYETWRNMLWDSASVEMDLSDARYLSRSKWLDEDILLALAPERADLIRRSTSSDAYGTDGIARDADEIMDSQEEYLDNGSFERTTNGTNDRRRVRTIEMWFRKPMRLMKIIAGEQKFVGELFDKENPQHKQKIMAGTIIAEERLVMRVHVAIMTTKGLIHLSESPYKHDRFPFTPIWGYRRGRDLMPYGLIRGIRDVQDDINKSASKALYILNSNKVIMDEGAVDDIEELREEVADPAGIIVKKKGKDLTLDVDRGLDQSHVMRMNQSMGMIQSVSGVTDELLGRETNAQSGVAVQSRQQQGMMSTAKLFDNLRYAKQLQGEIQLSLIEQYFTEEKTFRITNERGSGSWKTINDGLPDNDIVRSKADFVISQDEWRATMRRAQSEQLMAQMGQMDSQVALVMLDLVIDSMDIPNREEMVKRIRSINGQRDPDATELTPEEEAKMAEQQKQAQIADELVKADLRDKHAKSSKTEAEAEKTIAQVADTKLQTEKTAIEAASAAIQTPQAIPIADKLLKSGGFISQEEMMAIQEQQLANRQKEEQAMIAPQNQPQNIQQPI